MEVWRHAVQPDPIRRRLQDRYASLRRCTRLYTSSRTEAREGPLPLAYSSHEQRPRPVQTAAVNANPRLPDASAN